MVSQRKRTDDRESNDVAIRTAKQRLEQSEDFRGRLGAIEIERRNDTLVLHGRVSSFYLKQILQTTLRDIEGVEKIDNQVIVVWPDHS